MKDPANIGVLTALSETYIKKGDYRLALVIAQKALGDIKTKRGGHVARLYNDLGLSHLYTGNDMLAKDAFKKALKADTDSIAAKINLAGLLTYYGHKANADLLYRTLPDPSKVNETGDLMHPRAREYHYAQRKNQEKNS